MQFEHWVSEHIDDAIAGQRRSNGPDDHTFRRASRNDEAADANLITGLDSHPGREVNGFRRRGRTCGRTWGRRSRCWCRSWSWSSRRDRRCSCGRGCRRSRSRSCWCSCRRGSGRWCRRWCGCRRNCWARCRCNAAAIHVEHEVHVREADGPCRGRGGNPAARRTDI